MFLTIVTIKCIIDKLEFKLDNEFKSLKLNIFDSREDSDK
jgi:hypothetical protein